MSVKFYVERYVLNSGWVRMTTGLDSLQIAENMKETLAKRYDEDEENFLICVVGT